LCLGDFGFGIVCIHITHKFALRFRQLRERLMAVILHPVF
jgi:hypothetical protein